MQTQNKKRVRSSFFISLLIAALLWQSKWLSLRIGLVALLLLETAIPLVFYRQNRELFATLDGWKTNRPDENSVLSWFRLQEQFIRRVALWESCARLAGFALLAYGFWKASGYVWVAVGLGLIYPLFIQFAITRKEAKRRQEDLKRRKREFQML